MILVTGGTGLVGSHLLLELTRNGEKVRAFRRENSDLEKVKKTFSWYEPGNDALFQSIEWFTGDLMDIFSVEDALEGVQDVYHCAGKVSFDYSERKLLMQINQKCAENLVNVALQKGIRKLCHVSSISTLGRSKQGETITEQHYWKTSRKNSVYALSKYAAEREIWRGMEEGLNAVIINPSVILGPGDWDNGSSKIFKTVWKGLPFYTSGSNGYVDVRDVVKIMVRLMKSDINSKRFIVSAEDLTYKQLITMIAGAFGKNGPLFKFLPWMGEIGWRLEGLKLLIGKKPTFTREVTRTSFKEFYYNNSEIKRAINYEFIPLTQSIKDTVAIFNMENTKN